MKDDDWFSLSAKEALRRLGTSREQGLSGAEAVARAEKYGFNELKEERKRTLLEIFIAQFSSFLVFILIAAAVVSAFLGEWLDAGAIGAILVLNAILGTAQEYRAEKAIEMLRKMTAPNSLVIRDGKAQMLPTRLLVPGDIVLFEAGNVVPADCRLTESMMLETNEASLTGESASVHKDASQVLPGEIPVAR